VIRAIHLEDPMTKTVAIIEAVSGSGRDAARVPA
jgi:hypothetical protein